VFHSQSHTNPQKEILKQAVGHRTVIPALRRQREKILSI
jgi:hypothetical protein